MRELSNQETKAVVGGAHAATSADATKLKHVKK
jgi:hypothetical protein